MTLKQPFFSIITVCRNEKKDIEAITIKNIINQTYKNFEWLVVDGGSTDGTVQILKRYQKHMAYFSSKKDRGIYHAMNQAIVKAKGQYLIFMNGGDGFVNTQVLAKTYHFINRDNHGHQLYFGEALLHENNIKKYIKWRAMIGIGIFKMVLTRNLFIISPAHQASFFHYSLFHQYGLYDETYQFAADYDFYLKIAKQEQFAFMNFNVCFYNIAQYNNRMANKKIRSAELADLRKIKIKNFGVVYYCYKTILLIIHPWLFTIYKHLPFLHRPWRWLKQTLTNPTNQPPLLIAKTPQIAKTLKFQKTQPIKSPLLIAKTPQITKNSKFQKTPTNQPPTTNPQPPTPNP